MTATAKKRLCQLAQGAFWVSLWSQLVQAEEIKIVSTEFSFKPGQIEAAAGHSISVVLDNSQAATEHEIAIPKLGFHLFAAAGETVRKTLQFEEAGEYPFTCDLPGHSEAGMRGKFLVND